MPLASSSQDAAQTVLLVLGLVAFWGTIIALVIWAIVGAVDMFMDAPAAWLGIAGGLSGVAILICAAAIPSFLTAVGVGLAIGFGATLAFLLLTGWMGR